MDFFNGLGKKFTNAARNVQEKTRDTVESTRLAADLRNARDELDRRYTALGRAYYENLECADAPAPEAEIAAVREAILRIEDLTAQRDKLNRQVRCAGCGSVQSEEARFCSNCGRPMPEQAPEAVLPDAEAEYCSRCGAMRCGGEKFCSLCGEGFEPEDRVPELPVPAEKKYAEPAEEPDYAENQEE